LLLLLVTRATLRLSASTSPELNLRLLDRTLLPTSTSLRTPAYLELNTSKGLELTTRTLNAETDLATAGQLGGLVVNAVVTESGGEVLLSKVFAAPLARSVTKPKPVVAKLMRLTTSRALMRPPRRQLKSLLWVEERRMIYAGTLKKAGRLATSPSLVMVSLRTPILVSPVSPSLRTPMLLLSALSYLSPAQFNQAARLLDRYSGVLTSRRATSASSSAVNTSALLHLRTALKSTCVALTIEAAAGVAICGETLKAAPPRHANTDAEAGPSSNPALSLRLLALLRRAVRQSELKR